MNALSRTYTLHEAAEAAAVSTVTIQNWIKREKVIGHRQKPGGHRKTRQLTFHNLMEIVTVAAILRVAAFDLDTAFKAAQSFAHTGGSDTDANTRDPGLPFDTEHGRTLLIVSERRALVTAWQPGTDPISNLRTFFRDVEGYVIIDMLDVFDHAMARLGLPPQDVMRDGYGGI